MLDGRSGVDDGGLDQEIGSTGRRLLDGPVSRSVGETLDTVRSVSEQLKEQTSFIDDGDETEVYSGSDSRHTPD
jgi:hypothetical protein